MSESGWYGLSGPSDPNARPEKARELAEEGIRTGPVIVGAAAVVVLIATQLFPKAYPLGVVLKGATLGTGTGLLAVGLVLTYRTTRVINFSHGAMGAVGAALAAGLTRGSLGLSWELALPIGVAAGVLCGAVVEVLIIRRFTKSPRLVLTVATIGLAQVLGGLAFYIPQWFDSPVAINRIESNLSDIHHEVSPVVFNGNDFLLLAAVPVVLGLLTWFLLRTETGMAVRGISENMDRARLLGIPVNRLTLLLWSITGGMAALAVILRTPNEGLRVDIAAGPIILLPALAAAVVTGMRSLTGAFFAGVGFGVLDQIVQLNVDKRAITIVVFLGAILIALVLKRETTSRALLADESSWDVVAKARKLPRNLARLPEVRIFQGVLLGIVVVAAVALPMFGTASQIDHGTKTLALALAALSLVVLTGWGGVVSLGQYALVGLGAMVTANLIVDRNTDLFVSLGASAVAGGVIALVLGIPALRVSGQFLAVTTLAFAVAMENYFLEPENFGSLLPDDIPRPELWDGRVDLSGQTPLYVLALFLVVATSMVIANLRRARTGRSISATRDNPRSAAAVGINTTEARLAGFVFAGIFAGLAGGIHAVVAGGIGAGAYPAATSLLVFSMAVIGGSSSIGGTLAGVVLIQVLAYYVVPEWQLIITGSGLLVILWLLPGGLARLYETVRDRIAYAAARSQGIQIVDDQAEEQHALPPPAPVDSGELAIVQQGTLLMCEGVEASYGSLKVLFGIDTVVGQGELLALLGTNGAGKSTLLRSIAGLLPADSGRVTFDGKDITRLPTEKIAKLGLSMMPGGRGVFPTLTVAENMRLAGWVLRHHRKHRAAARDNALALFPILPERWDQMAGDLSGGEQQQLSLAMALATRPKLLCIDELSLGLAPTIVNQLVEKVREIHRAGTSIVVVEQSINIALLLCERAVFLEKGQVRFRGPTAGLLDRPDVLRAVFLGGVEGVRHEPFAGRRTRGMALECHSLVKRFGGIRAVDGVDLTVPPSSIVGLIGHNGAGKTTMFDVLTGFLPADGGKVLLGGVDVTNQPSHRRAIKGLGRSFQEARLYPSLTVTEVLKVAMETHLDNRDPLAAALSLPVTMISERHALHRADELIELLGLGPYRDHLIGELSTGTRRIVELGCLLAHDPAVVLLDEPSAGVAQRDTEALGPLLRQVQGETGCSLVVIEHDMALLSSLCDALVALEQGSVIAWGAPDDVLADHRVVASYLGTDNEVVQQSGQRPRLPGHRPEREAGWLTRAQERW